jgi:hypothetical protein
MQPIMTIEPAVRAQMLVLLAGSEESLSTRGEYVTTVNPKSVLATAWSQHRLLDCKLRLEAGEQAPPIVVGRYTLGREYWYVVYDGNHRTVAAQQADKRLIRARVTYVGVCRPSRYVLVQNDSIWSVWHLGAEDSYYSLVVQNVSDDLRQALLFYGVQIKKFD